MQPPALHIAEQAQGVPLRVGGKGTLAVEEVDGAGGIEAERQRPPAPRQRERDVAQGAVAADRADMAGLATDLDLEAGAAFGEDHARALRLEPRAQCVEPARAMAAGGAVVEELDNRARHRRLW
jgi:hypothetical protein